MKIALFVHCYFPNHFYGTESYTYALARHLHAFGHQVSIITATFAGEPEQIAFIDEYEWDGIPIIRLDRNRIPNQEVRDTYYKADIRPVLERILRRERPDVVHVCHLINHTSALLEVIEALGIPTVATFTDFYGICFNNKLQAHDGSLCLGPDRARNNCVSCLIKELGEQAPGGVLKLAAHTRLRPLLAAGARTARGLLPPQWGADVAAIVDRPSFLADLYRTYRAAIAPTRFLRDAYQTNGFQGRLDISHFGIDIDRARKSDRSGEPLHLGFVGQLAPHKGVHLLLDALRQLPADRWRLSLWGDHRMDPPYTQSLQRMAEHLPVTFRGTFPASQMAERLAEIDILVIPSIWYENSPLILLQALATHTPVVIADVAGMTEFVEPFENGLHFARGNVESLASMLRHFCDDHGLARDMSNRTHYARTSQDMARDVLRIYEELV